MLVIVSCKKEDEIEKHEIKINAGSNNNTKIDTLPIADFKINQILNSDSTFTLNFSNKTLFGNTYTWYFGNGDSSNLFEPSIKVISNNTYTYTLKATNKYGSHSISKAITINSIPKLVSADFKVYLNIDSVNMVRLINKSKKFKKLLWKFSDNTTSTELNPIHEFSNNTERTIKLIVENEYNQKDSLTVTYPAGQITPFQNSVSIYLEDYKNLVYGAYRNLMYGSPGKYYSSNGPEFTLDPSPYTDFFYVYTNSLNVNYFITYFEYGKITYYLKQKTLNLTNLNSVMSFATGSFNFFDRQKTFSNSSTIYFNDTTLNVMNDNGMLKINDTKLGHSFQGYLSSISADNVYTFSTPIIFSGSFTNFESQSISVSPTTNEITSNHSWTVGIAQSTINIIYTGNK